MKDLILNSKQEDTQNNPLSAGEAGSDQHIQEVRAYRKPGFWITGIAVSLVFLVLFSFLTSLDINKDSGAGLQPTATQPSTVEKNSDPTVEAQSPTTEPVELEPTDEPATMPTEPPATEPPPTESTSPPATRPTAPPTTKPTSPPNTTPKDNVIAEGLWDFGPVQWKITNDGTLTISGNRSIQESLNYIWQDYSDVVTRIVVADGITTIPKEAFMGMTNVTTVYLSNTLETIYRSAFSNCTALRSVTIPASVTKIERYAFYGCTNMAQLEFAPGSRLNSIGEYAFAKSGIVRFSSPASLRMIDFHAFEDCSSLESLVLDGGIETVRAYAFENCISLKHIVLGRSLGSLTKTFRGCYAIETLEIYTSGSIGGFEDRKSLKSVIIGGDATKISGFEGCTALSEVTVTAPIKLVESYAFAGCVALTSIKLPNSVTNIRVRAFANTGLTKIVLPSSLTDIDARAFSGSKINEIVFTGDCPAEINQLLTNINAVVYYPADNKTWSEDMILEGVTFVPYGGESEG